MENKKIVFRDQVGFLRGEKKTLVVNLETRKNFFLSNEIVDLLKEAEAEGKTYIEFCNSFVDEDKEYIFNVVNKLISFFMVEGSMPDLFGKMISISLDITNHCNLRCVHCCVSASDSLKGKDLSTFELCNIIDKICSLNPKSISISGGEPLTRYDFKELMDYLRERFDGSLELMTNGVLIDKEMAIYIGSVFDKVSVSLDGVDNESCSLIRGDGVFEKSIQGIKFLREFTNCRLEASMVCCAENEKNIPLFNDLCKNQLGIVPLLRDLSPSTRTEENKELIHCISPEEVYSGEKLEKYLNIFREKCWHKEPPETFSCQAARREFQIDYVGDIYPCPALMDDQFYLGNIFEIDNFSNFIIHGEFKSTNGYSNLMKYFPYNLDKCKDCNKNLLCFSCVSTIIDQMKLGTLYYKCEENKKVYDLFWED